MQINAKLREKTGKSSKSLRQNRQLPAVIFGKHLTSIPVVVDYEAFNKVYSAVGETSLVELLLDGQAAQQILIKDVQTNPVTDKYLHAGFYKVNMSEKITAQIPVELVGEEKNPLLKSGEAVMLTLLNEIEVECLPGYLPSHFTIDVSTLTEVGQGITVAELSYDKEHVQLNAEDEELIVKLDYPEMQQEEEEVTEAEALEKIEATAEKKEEETEEKE